MKGTVRSMIAVCACCAASVAVGACSGDGSSGPPTDISNQPTSPHSSAQPPASVDRSQTGETNPGRPTETSSGNTPNTPGSSSGGAGNTGAPPGG